MDRHLTYVAMTRHRDTVKLYYDRGEFPEYEQLAERLSRANAKETTLDYAGTSVSSAAGPSLERKIAEQKAQADIQSEAVDRFGARRGIDVGGMLEVATRVMRDLAQQAKERFEAFRERGKKDQAMSRSFERLRSALSKPSAQPLESSPTSTLSSPSLPSVPSPSSTTIDRLASGKTMTVLLTRLVDRIEHVRAMQQGGLAELEGDRKLIAEMLKVIEMVKPGTTPLIASAQEQSPGLIDRIAKQHEGPARGRALWQAIKQEYAAQRDPAVMQERALKVQRQKEQRQERDRDLNQGRSR